MENCIFCKIVEKEILVPPVYEDDDVLVIKDRDPKAPVHLLIMPKKHIASLDDLKMEDIDILQKIFVTAKRIAEEQNVLGRYKVVINVGELAGQTVFHMHFHLLGGWEKTGDAVSELKQ